MMTYNNLNPIWDENTNAMTWVMACFFITFFHQFIYFEYQVTICDLVLKFSIFNYSLNTTRSQCHFNLLWIKIRSKFLNFNLFWINKSSNTWIISHNQHPSSNRSHGNTRSLRWAQGQECKHQVTQEHQVMHSDSGHGVHIHI